MATVSPIRPKRYSLPVAAALLLVALAFGGTFVSLGGYHFDRQGTAYYSGLTDALLSGQLYLKAEPDPRLAQLANPYLSYQGIPRMHDATYFRGHYYLYFGVAPVIVLMAPWKLVTGTFLNDPAADCTFAVVGFIFGLLILRHWLRLQPHRVKEGWIALGVLLWGLGSFVLVLSQSASFYGVPILCGYACIMVALYAVQRASTAASPGRAAGWMAGASLAWGLAVASRPHIVFSLPTLALPLAWQLLRDGGRWSQGRRWRLVGATLVPAAIVGALLAWYN